MRSRKKEKMHTDIYLLRVGDFAHSFIALSSNIKKKQSMSVSLLDFIIYVLAFLLLYFYKVLYIFSPSYTYIYLGHWPSDEYK
jgi:hypothetical protein